LKNGWLKIEVRVASVGAGFRAQGERYFRISAFNSRENAEEVAHRLEKLA